MKQLHLLLTFILFFFLHPLPTSAYNMGKYEIKIGEKKTVSVEDRPNITISSTPPQVIGNSIKIISRGTKSCTVQGIQEGTSILKWSGIVDGTPYEMEWTFDVILGVAPNQYFYENNEDGIRLFYVGWDYGGFTYPALSSIPEGQPYGGQCHISDAEVASANGKLVIPETAHGVTVFRIGKNSIKSLNNLTDLVLPINISFIDHYGIGNCPNLKTFTCKSPSPPKKYYANGKMFDNSILNATLYVPKGSVEKYRAADEWKDFKSIQEIGTTGKEIQINATNFPDKNFRDYLLSLDEGKDGKFSESEISKITYINVDSKGISSLKGIEYFTELINLSCLGNQLDNLDLSKNTALTSLDCSKNQLAALDVSKNVALTKLACNNNKLISIDVSKSTVLTWFLCGNNQLKKVDISKNTALTTFDCYNNQITTLDVSNNAILEYIGCGNNQLTSLVLSNNKALKELQCYLNRISGKSMNELIGSLPTNSSNVKYTIKVYNGTNNNEGNVCTKSQVAAIKAKGWTPLCYNGSEWVEYEGSDEVPDIQLISVKSNNKDLTNLSPNDNLVLEGIFKNTGATSVIDTRLRIWNQDMEAVAYSSSLSNEFKTNVQTTVKHEYALTNIPEGTYYATIQYYEEWDRQKWVYYKNLLVSFNVKKSSDGYKDGDFFTAETQEGINMSFQVVSATDKTCMVKGEESDGINNSGILIYPAINDNISGNITIPSEANGFKVIKIGETAFSSRSMKSIDIPNTVEVIGEEAFSYCKSLISMIIPNSIKRFDYYVVYGCSKLESIISYIQEPHDIDWKVFWSEWEVFTPATLYVPKGTKSTYLSKKGWGLFNNSIVEFDPSTFDPTTLGIHDVMMDDDKNAPIYDLFGRKLSQPNKGINIIGRKKVVVK